MCAWSNLLQCNYKLKCIRNRLSAAADFYSFRVLACLSRDGVCPSHKDGMLCHNVMMLSPPADETPVQVYSGVGRACCQSRETNFHFLDRPRLRLLKKILRNKTKPYFRVHTRDSAVCRLVCVLLVGSRSPWLGAVSSHWRVPVLHWAKSYCTRYLILSHSSA